MNNLEVMWNLKEIDIIIEIMELIIIVFFTYCTFIKITNPTKLKLKNIIIIIISSCAISIVVKMVQYNIDKFLSMTLLVCLLSIINYLVFKNDVVYSILITIISLSINYALFTISIIISFFPLSIIRIKNDYLDLFFIVILYLVLYKLFHSRKRIKHGIAFLREKLQNAFFSVLSLNLASIILFFIIILQSDVNIGSRKIGISFVIFSVIMLITIKQSLDIYYKQNLLTKDLETTKKELEAKKKEIDKLERENLEFSKTSHSLAHKQKALEFKLEQFMKTDIDVESKETIKEEIEKVSKELYKEPNEVRLVKTEIESIDNMFSYMQSECIKNNIKFELQVVGNIYYMINNLISEIDLEILIADHIKDAIIAINNSNNLNRSILVRIGKIDNVYSLYIYDSGIEFTKEVLDNLGKKPITTHADTGGTGMGFMNTFDTLNKTKASFIINEIGKPCEDNYTKVLIFKFDKQNEFKVNSYKNEVAV